MLFCQLYPPPTNYILTLIKPFFFVWYVIPLLKIGVLALIHDPFLRFWRWKTSKKKRCSHVPFMLLDIILTRWQHPLASSQALDILHWVMHVVTYQCIAMAIKTASFVGVFVDCCLRACCPGGRWGNTEQVVAQCRHPVASRVALDMLHWAMRFVLHRRIAMAIKTANDGGTCWCHCWFHHRQ